MRAAIFDAESRRVSIETRSVPQPGPDDILVRVCRCGICGSDVSMTSDAPFSYGSGQFGHEYSGEVIEVGRNVASHRPGDKIATFPVAGCGDCETCRRGFPFFCPRRQSASFGFGEYAVLPPRVAIRLPQSLSFADGALVEPMACGLHALNLARLEAGGRVLVLGAGSMALSAVYWARRMGAGRIAALSRSEHRRDMVMTMGADAMTSFDPEERGRIVEALGGPPDIVCECVGKAGMVALAVDLVRPGGTVVSMGMCMQPESLLPAQCVFKEVRLLFPLGYTTEEFAQTARAFDAESLRPDAMVSDVIALEALPARLQAMRSGGAGGGLKVQVDPARG